MRYLHDIPNSQFKIGLYAWNNKYILKIEAGLYEQTYKLDETDVLDPAELPKLLDLTFLEQVTRRFNEMARDWGDAVERQEIDG